MRNNGSGFNGSDFLAPARLASESVAGRPDLRFFCFSFDVGRSMLDVHLLIRSIFIAFQSLNSRSL